MSPARTRTCTPNIQAGRLHKAQQFLFAASVIKEYVSDDDLDDAYITLLVHAGIAAADVLCCARLGVHAQGDNHNEAIKLLESAGNDDESKKLARHLSTLLGMKTDVGYSHMPASASDRKRAERAAESLAAAATKAPRRGP